MSYENIGFDNFLNRDGSIQGMPSGAEMNRMFLSGSVPGQSIRQRTLMADRLMVGSQQFTHSIVFTPNSADKVSWTSGLIYFTDGSSVEIDAGDTGNLNVLTSAYSTDADTKALFHADETTGTTADDASANTYDATLTNVTVNETGVFDKAFKLAGTATSHISVPYQALDTLTAFTVEMWYKRDGASAETYFPIISGANASYDNGLLWGISVSVSQWNVVIANTWYSAPLKTDIRDGEWHHIALVRSGTVAYIYVDFVLERTLTVASTALDIDSGGLFIGQDQDSVGGGFDANQTLKGWVDEIRISNTARAFSPAGTRYIYYDGTSTLAVTTDMSLVRGDKKQLLAIMQPSKYYGPCAVTLVGMDGTYIDADKIKTGRLESSDGRTYFDLNDNRIIMNDGTNDRLLLGLKI